MVRVEAGSPTIVEQYTYSPYGQVVYADILDAEAPLSRVGFQGLFFDRFDTPRAGQTLAPAAGTPGNVSATPTGLYYARNRFYAPELGRFVTRDVNATALPIITAAVFNAETLGILAETFDPLLHYADGLNLFAFAAADPINTTDPLGLFLGLDLVLGTGTRSELEAQRAQVAGGALALLLAMLGSQATQLGVAGGLSSTGFDLFLDGIDAFMAGSYAVAERLMEAAIAGVLVIAQKYAGMTVGQIIAMYKKGSIMNAPLPPGGPGWNEILRMLWEEIEQAARSGKRWAKTVKKLLTDRRFDK